MYYRPDFLLQLWAEYLHRQAVTADQVDPDAFLRFGYARLLDNRQPRYAAMARGVSPSPPKRWRRCADPAGFRRSDRRTPLIAARYAA